MKYWPASFFTNTIEQDESSHPRRTKQMPICFHSPTFVLSSRPATMSKHRSETAFLKGIIAFDESDAGRDLERRLVRAETNERCVRRAALLVAGLAMLCAVGFGYGTVLQENFFFSEHRSEERRVGKEWRGGGWADRGIETVLESVGAGGG